MNFVKIEARILVIKSLLKIETAVICIRIIYITKQCILFRWFLSFNIILISRIHLSFSSSSILDIFCYTETHILYFLSHTQSDIQNPIIASPMHMLCVYIFNVVSIILVLFFDSMPYSNTYPILFHSISKSTTNKINHI